MNKKNEFIQYKNEMELILKQNPIECELYSIIAPLIRSTICTKNISLRDVTTRRKSEFSGSKIFASEAGFPDFVLLDKEFELFDEEKRLEKYIFGAVEIKRMTISIKKESEQVSSHINKFGSIIYTNGLEWTYYKNSYENYKWNIKLGEIKKGTLVWFEDKWTELIDKLKSIQWCN